MVGEVIGKAVVLAIVQLIGTLVLIGGIIAGIAVGGFLIWRWRRHRR